MLQPLYKRILHLQLLFIFFFWFQEFCQFLSPIIEKPVLISPDAPANKLTMYPRVKVREQEEYDDQYDFESRSLQSLRIPESFSLIDCSSPDNSPTSVVRVPQFYSSTSVVIKDTINNRKQKVLDENRTNIRASPVLRPRAVLSSPDNDQMVGSKNKTKGESLSSAKKQSPHENRHARCEVIPRPVAADDSINTRRQLKEVASSESDIRTRQRTVITDTSLRANLQAGRPKSVKDRALRSLPTNE